MAGALELAREEGENAAGGVSLSPGGLGQFAMEEDPLETGRHLLRQTGTTLGPDALSEFSQRANGAPKSMQERREEMMKDIHAAIDEQRSAGRQSLDALRHPPINRGVPWLNFAAGMMQPTKTGAFGESLGYGMSGLAKGYEDINKQELDFSKRSAELGYGISKDNVAAIEGMHKLGFMPDQIEAALQMMQARLQAARYKILPTRGLVDTMAPGGPQMVKGFETLSLAQLQTQAQKNIDRYLSSKVFTNPAEMDAERQRLYRAWENGFQENPDAIVNQLLHPKGGMNSIGLPSGVVLPPEPPPGTPQAAAAPPGAPPAAAAPVIPGAPPAPAPPGPQVYPKGSPQLAHDVEYQKKLAESRSSFEDELVNEKRGAVTMNRSLDELETAIKGGKSGTGAALFAALSKLKIQAGLGTDRDIEIAKNFETADKVSGGLASSFVKSISGRPTQFEFISALSRFIPAMEQTEAGSKNVISILRQINNVAATQPSEYYKWRQGNPQGDHRHFVNQFWDHVSQLPLSAEAPYGGGALPEGVPLGSKKVGFAKGSKDEVWQTPNGERFRVPVK